MNVGFILLRGWKTQSNETKAPGSSGKPIPTLNISDEGIRLANAMSAEHRDWCLSWAFWLQSLVRTSTYAGTMLSDLRRLSVDPEKREKWMRLVSKADLASWWEGDYKELVAEFFKRLDFARVFPGPKAFIDAASYGVLSRIDDWETPDLPESTPLEAVIELLFAFTASAAAGYVFGKTLNALLAEARGGRDQALFDAVRVDPGVLACPTAAQRIRKAALNSDTPFFTHLSTALLTRIPEVEQFEIDIEMSLNLIKSSGALSSLNARAAQLIFLEVRPSIYADTGEDPRGSLNRRVQRFKAKSRTNAPEQLS